MSKLTLFKKPNKAKMTGLFLVFLWIVLWNVIYQVLHHRGLLEFGSVEIKNWSFFIAVTIFFMQEELSYLERFVHTLVGGIVGLLLGCCVPLGVKFLMTSAGMTDSTGAIIIMLVIAIAALILLNPICPIVFNNVGFCYFIISLINSSTAVEELPSNIASLVAGSICLNLGCIAILTLYKKAIAKKKSK